MELCDLLNVGFVFQKEMYIILVPLFILFWGLQSIRIAGMNRAIGVPGKNAAHALDCVQQSTTEISVVSLVTFGIDIKRI